MTGLRLPLPDNGEQWLIGVAVLLLTVLVIHKAVSLFARTYVLGDTAARRVLVASRAPVRVILVGTVLLVWTRRSLDLLPSLGWVEHVSQVIVIAGFGFLAVRLIGVLASELVARLPLEASNDVRHRRAQTQILLLRRLSSLGIWVVTVGIILWTFPDVRAIGTSILASAGLIGVLAGVAARSTFGNLVAGVQIAFAEPIRLDDVVVVDGEWGRVEEITLTYVVVRSWDRRRIVMPTSWFVENRFENWTRVGTDLLGSVVLHLDPTADVGRLRSEAGRFVATRDEWDGEVCETQVIDAGERAQVVRFLVSAPDALQLWDLRCAVREHLLVWIRENCPADLVRVRTELDGAVTVGSALLAGH